jgi:hypothetical protein
MLWDEPAPRRCQTLRMLRPPNSNSPDSRGCVLHFERRQIRSRSAIRLLPDSRRTWPTILRHEPSRSATSLTIGRTLAAETSRRSRRACVRMASTDRSSPAARRSRYSRVITHSPQPVAARGGRRGRRVRDRLRCSAANSSICIVASDEGGQKAHRVSSVGWPETLPSPQGAQARVAIATSARPISGCAIGVGCRRCLSASAPRSERSRSGERRCRQAWRFGRRP